jgi:hypothetical protein
MKDQKSYCSAVTPKSTRNNTLVMIVQVEESTNEVFFDRLKTMIEAGEVPPIQINIKIERPEELLFSSHSEEYSEQYTRNDCSI